MKFLQNNNNKAYNNSSKIIVCNYNNDKSFRSKKETVLSTLNIYNY